MTLEEFLTDKTLDAVDVLPDDRLFNVIVDGGQTFGVVVDNVPPDTHLIRVDPATVTGTTLTADGMVFDTTQYEML